MIVAPTMAPSVAARFAHRPHFSPRGRWGRKACPSCGALSLVTRTVSRAGARRCQVRACANGHNWIWRRGVPWRPTARPAPSPALCQYPSCFRPTAREAWRRKGGARSANCKRSGRWCSGHYKQKQRHGVAAMRPLRERPA